MAKRTASAINHHDWFQEMRKLALQARFKSASETYDDAVASGEKAPFEARVLQARLLLKQDETRAMSFLADHEPEVANGSQRGQWSLLLAVGYGRMRDFERADHHFEIARRHIASTSDSSELAYQQARRVLIEGRTDEAREFAAKMAGESSAETRVRQKLLESFILSHEERYRDEAVALIDIIRTIGKRRTSHLEDWFYAVLNLAVLARELPNEEAVELARTEVDQEIEWPEDFHLQRFMALKAVGWTRALHGDMLGCFRYLRMAEFVAPSDAYRVILGLDRAHFATIIGEKHWAQDEVAKAEALADSVNWNAQQGDERLGLLLLAEIVAHGNPEKARIYLARYNGLDRMRSPLYLFAFDHRTEAYAAYVEGVVKVAMRQSDAEDSFRSSWVIFDRIGYDWRAGRTALRLFDVTHKQRWIVLAEDKLESYSQSWLIEELHAAMKPAPLQQSLTPMQRRVLELLCGRMSTKEISETLGLSPHTVRNHLKAAFKTYGVSSQAALVAETVRRGDLVPADIARRPENLPKNRKR